MPQPSASDSRARQAAELAAEEGAEEFAEAGDGDQADGEQRQVGPFQHGEVGAEARTGRKTPA